jgi:glutamate dehydrogenase (NAD(P)+)
VKGIALAAVAQPDEMLHDLLAGAVGECAALAGRDASRGQTCDTASWETACALTGTARACARAGARIVGVSTVDGLLADQDGLDIEELLALRALHGDRFVEHGPRKVRPREALFELECDVLVPGARPDSITSTVAKRVRCAVVAPGANIPYGPGAVEVLRGRGILAVPDFVSNSGANHLYDTVSQDAEPPAALAAIEAVVREAAARALSTAEELGITPYAAALRDARDFLARSTRAPREALDALVPG